MRKHCKQLPFVNIARDRLNKPIVYLNSRFFVLYVSDSNRICNLFAMVKVLYHRHLAMEERESESERENITRWFEDIDFIFEW